mgnify:CR=1 FL=1
MDDFFAGWFVEFSKGLNKLNDGECGRLFADCGKTCAGFAVKYLYKDLFEKCGRDLDNFFSRLDEVKDVGGAVVETGKVYDIIFKTCGCPLHAQANVSSGKLCECSRQSMICVFETLVPGRKFNIQKMESILGGNNLCKLRISFEE